MLDANTCLVPPGLKVNPSSLQKAPLESTNIEGYTQERGWELGEILNVYFGNFLAICLFFHEQVSYAQL